MNALGIYPNKQLSNYVYNAVIFPLITYKINIVKSKVKNYG